MSGLERYLSAPQLARQLDVQDDARPFYRALADGVRALILDGRLALRTRLPAERHLAETLGVSRTTVTAAYDRLRELGFIESRRGSGSWTALPSPGSAGAPGWPTIEDGLMPLHCVAMPASAAVQPAIAWAADEIPRYTLGPGYEPLGVTALREAVARRYTKRGLPTRPDQVLITTGAQHAIHLLFGLLVNPGDGLLLESPTYMHALEAARRSGARLAPVGIGEDGWDLDLVVSGMRQAAVRVAYVIADFHNPTGWLMDGQGRAALVAAARRGDAFLIVDEAWAEVAIDDLAMPSPVAAYDTDGRVISIGSAGKLWWGGLRVGWIRAPAALIRRLAHFRAAVDFASPVLDQLVVARLFDSIEQTRRERSRFLAEGRAALTAALAAELPMWSFVAPSGGGALWVRLDEPIASTLADAAAAHGLRLAPGPWFGPDGTLERYIRLPFTHPPQLLADAVRRLAAARQTGPYGVRPMDSLTPAL